MKRRELFGVRYNIGNMDDAVLEVLGRIKELNGKYICFSNVHTLVTAVENEKYKKVLNSSAYTFPDGAPVAWRLRRNGNTDADRIAGPDFMEEVFRSTADGDKSHFFYGSSVKVLDKLRSAVKRRYPNIKIAGSYAPPFRKLTAEEDRRIVSLINQSGADIIWIGLGAPRQELFMHRHMGVLDGVMIGVGAGFDFLSGTVRRAPVWMQRLSLEWMYRLLNEPGRLARRYLVTNSKFIWYCLKQEINRR